MQYAWWWLFDSRRWRCMHVLAHKGLGADATSINRIVVRLLFVSNDSSLRLETSNKTQLQFWWLYLFHIYNEFITDEATISIRPLIRCNPIVFVYFNLTMLRARDSTKFYFQRCDHHSKCKTIKSYVTMVYDQIFRVYTKFLRLQEFRKWKLKEISSYDKKNIYIFSFLFCWQTWRVATFVATVYNGDVIISIPRTTCRKAARNVHAMPVYTRRQTRYIGWQASVRYP